MKEKIEIKDINDDMKDEFLNILSDSFVNNPYFANIGHNKTIVRYYYEFMYELLGDVFYFKGLYKNDKLIGGGIFSVTTQFKMPFKPVTIIRYIIKIGLLNLLRTLKIMIMIEKNLDNKDYAYGYNLFIAPSEQKTISAHHLFKYGFDFCQKNNIKGGYIDTQDIRLVRYYKRYGFELFKKLKHDNVMYEL